MDFKKGDIMIARTVIAILMSVVSLAAQAEGCFDLTLDARAQKDSVEFWTLGGEAIEKCSSEFAADKDQSKNEIFKNLLSICSSKISNEEGNGTSALTRCKLAAAELVLQLNK
jgi:hypothetical protein